MQRPSDLDNGPDDPYVPGALYKAAQWADYGKSKPRFDGSDVREVESSSVLGGELSRTMRLIHGTAVAFIDNSVMPKPSNTGV